jgi:hypothetical protein
MNPSAIYSKSGKGVQEAAGKTNHLSRPDRAVLSAIDGRATLAEVAQKVGKTFDAAFEKLVGELDKAGFVREVSAGTPAAGVKPGAAAAKPAGKSLDPVSDLDFTAALSMPRGKAATPPPQSPPKPAAPKPTVNIPPPPPPPSAAEKAKAEKAAKEQQDAFAKAREEAEKKAAADRERVKAEAEAKVRAETEAKMRAEAKEAADRKFAEQIAAKAEAEKKAAAEAADAKVRAATKAAAEAKAKAEAEAKKAEAEAKKAREDAERVRKEAEEKAERARKEAEEKARREQEELMRKLEQERKAREEAERKAMEEARRLEEERRKLEEERKRHEEEKRREEEERVARRKREEEEEARQRAERKKRAEEEEAREQAEREARRKAKAQEEEKAKEVEFSLPELNVPAAPKAPEPVKAAPPPAAPAGGGAFSDSLLADLDSFSTRDEQEQKEREEQLRKEKEAAAQRAREAEERRLKEEGERKEKEEKKRLKEEERARKAKEEAELREAEEKEKQRLKEEEDKRKKEAEEREKKAKQEERLAARAERGGQFDAEARARREAALQARPVRAKGERVAAKGGWGKPIAIALFLLLVIAVGVAHVMPIDTSEYERGAAEALGQPVKVGSANLSLIGGLQLKFHNVSIGDTRIAELRGFPEFDALLGPNKAFSRIEVDGAKVPQEALGPALFTKVKAQNFSVARVVAKNLELTGPLAMPKGLELDASYNADGTVRTAFLRGPEALVVKLEPKGQTIEADMSAATISVPFAPDVSFGRFSAKGTISSHGFNITEWDAAALNGTLSGTANITWGDTWVVEGVLTARNINAAVFAPALISDGRAEGSGRFSMRGTQPAKLGEAARIDGTFTINRGVLGSFDLARAVQSQGRAASGRTQFAEMTGNGVYDRGAVALRNVTLGAGQLNAGASADIAQNGALSGRIVADVRIASQQMRAVLNLGGTVREPQVRN